MQRETEWATIGKIVAPLGLRGELKVLSFSDIPDRFSTLKTIYITPHYTTYSIKSVRPYKGNMVIVKLAGINDANAAEHLRNCDLVIPSDQLTELPRDSYYQHDIIGLQVVTLAGRVVGTITEILPTAANDVYIVKTDTGQQHLIPAVKNVVKRVDLSQHLMYIEPIGGLIDEDAATVEDDTDALAAEKEGE